MTDRLEQLTRLHQADPADPFCTYGIALEHAKAGNSDEALHWLEKTLEIDPAYCYAYYQKARLLVAKDQHQQARAALREGMAAARRVGDQHAHTELEQLLANIPGT